MKNATAVTTSLLSEDLRTNVVSQNLFAMHHMSGAQAAVSERRLVQQRLTHRAEHSVVEALRSLHVIGADHHVTEHGCTCVGGEDARLSRNGSLAASKNAKRWARSDPDQ